MKRYEKERKQGKGGNEYETQKNDCLHFVALYAGNNDARDGSCG